MVILKHIGGEQSSMKLEGFLGAKGFKKMLILCFINA